MLYYYISLCPLCSLQKIDLKTDSGICKPLGLESRFGIGSGGI
jgi:hypothetical protein